jgi:hypothetical protein
MSPSPVPPADQLVRRRGLPLIVVVGAVLTLGGLLALLVAPLAFRGSAERTTSLMDEIAIVLALAGLAISVLAAALTRPGTERRGFSISVGAALVGAATVGFAIRAIH